LKLLKFKIVCFGQCLFAFSRAQSARRLSDVQQWPSGQTEAALLPKGRANSELRNVATRPQGGAAQKKQPLKKETASSD